jgi:hypothetical protein
MIDRVDFDEFVAAGELAFSRDPGDASLGALGFVDVLDESLDEPSTIHALFATFVAHGRQLGRTSAMFRLRARPLARVCGVAPADALLSVNVTLSDASARVVLPMDSMASTVLVDLGADVVAAFDRGDAVELDLATIDPDVARVVELPRDKAQILTADADRLEHARLAAARLGDLAVAFELLGVGDALVALGVAHARDREQFGQPIASFQAVQHHLAWASLDVDSARELCHAAIDGDPTQEVAIAAVARALTSRNVRRGADRIAQVLGGMGFTWEHPFHRFHRRALLLGCLVGRSASVFGRVGAHVRGGGDPAGLLRLVNEAPGARPTSSSLEVRT